MRRKLMGRHPLTIGAAILLGLSVYEMWVLLILALAAAGAGIALEIYALSGWVQIIKLIPLALIVMGSMINMTSREKQRGHRKK